MVGQKMFDDAKELYDTYLFYIYGGWRLILEPLQGATLRTSKNYSQLQALFVDLKSLLMNVHEWRRDAALGEKKAVKTAKIDVEEIIKQFEEGDINTAIKLYNEFKGWLKEPGTKIITALKKLYKTVEKVEKPLDEVIKKATGKAKGKAIKLKPINFLLGLELYVGFIEVALSNFLVKLLYP